MFRFILRHLNPHATCAEGSAETLKHLQIAQIAQIAHSLAELQRSCLLTSTQVMWLPRHGEEVGKLKNQPIDIDL